MFAHLYAHAAVPALVDIVGHYVADLTLASNQQLSVWLPALPKPPEGWAIGRLEPDQAPTRIALHRNASGASWDGCEVINLFAFTGSLPHEMAQANVACTLQAIGADNVISRPLFMASPSSLGVTAACASGDFMMNGQRVWARYTAYRVEGRSGTVGDYGQSGRGGLVERNTFITDEAHPRVHRELVQMGDALHEALKSALAHR